MKKIAIIGAGSLVFTKQFLNDMFNTPALSGSRYYLMGPTMWKLEKMKQYADLLIAKNDIRATIVCTTDRREALKDADFVICTFLIGGNDAYTYDIEIPLKYGVDQCIGDSLGPGGIFRMLRTAPLLKEMGREIDELCPNAYILNYVNPMGAVCTTLAKCTKAPTVGLCHGVQTTLDLISGYTDVPKDEIDFINAGINHMDWFLKLEHKGRDLYPILKKNMEDPRYYRNEKVRGELMRHCGYFMTESSGHLSEYIPWFRSSKEGLETYCNEPMFGGETGAALKFNKAVAEKFKTVDVFSIESGELEPRSKEYCSYIIEAIVTDKPFRFSGNVPNRDGLIENLPRSATVEVPVYADRYGFHPYHVGELPPHLAAMNMSNLVVQDLASRAALDGDPLLAFWAVAMDPLTSTKLTLKNCRKMVLEMFEAEKAWLPQFDGKTLADIEDIDIPEGTIGVPVPVDPALAINERFNKLAE